MTDAEKKRAKELAKKIELAEKAGQAALALEKPPGREQSEKIKFVEAVRRDIVAMRAKGWSFAKIAAMYKDAVGDDAPSAETIRYVVKEAPKHKRAARSARLQSKEAKDTAASLPPAAGLVSEKPSLPEPASKPHRIAPRPQESESEERSASTL